MARCPRRRRRHDGRHGRHGRRQPHGGCQRGRAAHPEADRPDRHPRLQRRQRLRHRRDRVPRGVYLRSRPARPTWRSPSASSRWARCGLLGAGGRAKNNVYEPQGPLRLGDAGRGRARYRPHARRVRPGGHGVRQRARRRRLRAVRQGRREEPRPLDAQPARAVPEAVLARRGHGRRDDGVPEHAADVLPDRRRERGAGARLGGEAREPFRRPAQAGGEDLGVGADDRPVDRDGQVQPDVNTLTRNAANQAYESAGRRPADLDLVELHDCFATAELIHYDNLGLCKPGEAGKFIDERGPWRDGKIPVNVSGGLISKGHPIGATGIANVFEVSTHLRGRGRRPSDRGRQGRAHPRDRPRLGLRRPHPREVRRLTTPSP